MSQRQTENDTWLSLTEAAERLGVHPSTVRRWADQGQLPFMRTPGGHRRFTARDIETFTNHRREESDSVLTQDWARNALVHTRSEIISQRNAQWIAAFDPEDRERKRALGRRLMGLMLQYVSLEEGGEELLGEARSIGHQYAMNALQLNMPLTDALRAALFFRDTVVDATLDMPNNVHVSSEARRHLLNRLNTLLNVVQLAVAELYEQDLLK